MGRPRLRLKCDKLPTDVRKEILRMAAEGASAHRIQEWLHDEKKLHDIGYFSILQFLKLRSELGKQFIYENPEFKNKVQEEFSDIIVDYSRMYNEVKELYFDCKRAGNAKGMLLAAEEMRKQVELIKALLIDTGSSASEPQLIEDKRGKFRELDRAISKVIEGAVADGVIELKQTEQTVTLKPKDEVEFNKKNIVECKEYKVEDEKTYDSGGDASAEGDSKPEGDL